MSLHAALGELVEAIKAARLWPHLEPAFSRAQTALASATPTTAPYGHRLSVRSLRLVPLANTDVWFSIGGSRAEDLVFRLHDERTSGSSRALEIPAQDATADAHRMNVSIFLTGKIWDGERSIVAQLEIENKVNQATLLPELWLEIPAGKPAMRFVSLGSNHCAMAAHDQPGAVLGLLAPRHDLTYHEVASCVSDPDDPYFRVNCVPMFAYARVEDGYIWARLGDGAYVKIPFRR